MPGSPPRRWTNSATGALSSSSTSKLQRRWSNASPRRDTLRHHHPGYQVRRFVVEARGNVAVYAEGDSDGRVTKALLNDLRVNSSFKGQGCPRVPEAMDREARQAKMPDPPEEGVAHAVWS